MFPLGIAMTVIGATRKEDSGAVFTAIMAIGIVFVVLGFYGAPMSWVTYAPKKKYARIIDAINAKVSETQPKLQTISRCNQTKL